MADCREQLELYADKIGVTTRRVTMVSSEEELSSNGGIPALRQLDDQVGITRLISRALFDPRDPDRITYEQQTLIRQRVYQIAAGYEDCNDADDLCHDPAFLTALALHDHGRSGSQPTLSRIEERCSAEDIVRLQTAWLHHWIDRVKASGRPRAGRRWCWTLILLMTKCTVNSSCRCGTDTMTSGVICTT